MIVPFRLVKGLVGRCHINPGYYIHDRERRKWSQTRRWMKHSCICSCITQDQDFARAVCSSRVALSCWGEQDWALSLQQHQFQTSNQLNIQPGYVLWIFEYFSQTFPFPEGIHLSDTRGCEKPSRNKPRYVNPTKLEFTANFQQPVLPREACVLFAQLYGDRYWLQSLLKDFLQLFCH